MRITPVTYAVEDAEIFFSTWENSDAVRNTRRDGRASVLIDKADEPYAGVHDTGRAHAQSETITGGSTERTVPPRYRLRRLTIRTRCSPWTPRSPPGASSLQPITDRKVHTQRFQQLVDGIHVAATTERHCRTKGSSLLGLRICPLSAGHAPKVQAGTAVRSGRSSRQTPRPDGAMHPEAMPGGSFNQTNTPSTGQRQGRGRHRAQRCRGLGKGHRGWLVETARPGRPGLCDRRLRSRRLPVIGTTTLLNIRRTRNRSRSHYPPRTRCGEAVRAVDECRRQHDRVVLSAGPLTVPRSSAGSLCVTFL